MARFAIQRVKATPEALELIAELSEKHGPLAFFQSGGCSDGSVPICLTKRELLPGPSHAKVGEIGGAPFYVDEEEYQRSGGPALVIDIAPGAPGGVPLAGLDEIHFVTRTPDRSEVIAR